MTELVVADKASEWRKLKALVLDSVSSPITKRVYNLGLDEFIAWYTQEFRATPSVNRVLHPGRHWNASHAVVLPDKIHNAPSVVSLLNMRHRERSYFRASQPTTEKR